MVDRIGEFARSYWLVLASVIGAAAGWGALYERVDSGDRKLDRLSATMERVEPLLAATVARGDATDRRVADIIDRVKLLEAARR